jgi:hypothetical protein
MLELEDMFGRRKGNIKHKIAGYDNSSAQYFAEVNKLTFASLGKALKPKK